MKVSFVQYILKKVRKMMKNRIYLSQLKVLYIEDEAETREELSSFLKRRVGRLYIAKNGKEGLEIFLENDPDIVIADLLMPEMYGIDMLKKMREYDKKCRFIITSSVNKTEVVLDAVDIGIVKYAVKPINLPELDDLLNKVAEEIFKERKSRMIIDGDKKRSFETEIKKELALFLKNNAGKGPRDVAVFIHDKSIEAVVYESMTLLEQKIMSVSGNANIAEQTRRYFYLASKKEIEIILEKILKRKVKLIGIDINPYKNIDKITAELTE